LYLLPSTQQRRSQPKIQSVFFGICNSVKTSYSCLFKHIYLHLLSYTTGWRKKNACPLAPMLTRFICLRFFSLGLPQITIYVRKPRTVDDLKVSIHKEIAIVPQEMLVNVMQNFEEGLRTCVRQEGRHLSDIIFLN